jgi:predicted dehydrogenase
MRKLKVAVVGAGYFSQFHHEAWSAIAEVDFVATCDRDEAKARAYAERFGVPAVYSEAGAMLECERPDIFDIATPSESHLALIRLAAARGVATICQKAFCRSLAEAEEAVRIAHQAGILLVVHENFRFQPWYAAAKRQIKEGALGEVYQVSFRLRPGDGQGPCAYLDRQPYFQRMERFLVHETAVHFIDTFRYLSGEIAEVFADLRRLNPVIAGEDAGVILFKHASGARSLFDGNRLVDHRAENRRYTMGELLIEGSAAVLSMDGEGVLRLRRHASNDEETLPSDWPRSGFGGGSVERLQRHVVDHILRGGSVMNTARDYLANLRVQEAVYDSAACRRVRTLR